MGRPLTSARGTLTLGVEKLRAFGAPDSLDFSHSLILDAIA